MRRSLPSARSALGWTALLLICTWATATVPFLDKCVQHRTYPFSLHQNHSIFTDVNSTPMSTSTLHVDGAITLISHNIEKDFCVYRMTVAFTSRVNVSGTDSSSLPSTASDEEQLRHFMASWADVQSMTRVQPVIFKQALSGEISEVHIPYPEDTQNTAGIKMAVEALLDQLSFSASRVGEAAQISTKEVDNFDEDSGSSTPLVLSMSDKYTADLSKPGVRAYRFERDVFPAHGPTGPQSAPHMVNRREITETFVLPGHPGFALSLHKTVVASVRSGDITNAEDVEWASGAESPFSGSFGFRMESVTILGSASDFVAEIAEFVSEPIVFEPREIDMSSLSSSASPNTRADDEFSPFDETDETLTTRRDADDDEEEEGLYDAVQTEADRRETGGYDIFDDSQDKTSDVKYPSLLSVRERSGDLTDKQRRRLARANMRLRSSRSYATSSESSSFGFNPKAESSEESSRGSSWEHSSIGSESSFSRSSSSGSSSSSGEIGVERVDYKTVFEKRVWFGGVKDMLGYFDGGIRAAAWELNDQKVIDLGIVFDIGAMFWGQQFSVIRAVPGSRLFMNTRKAKWTLNVEEPHRPEALRMVRSLFGFSFPVEEDPRKPQDKFPECGPKPGPWLKRTLDEYYYARKVPKKVDNRFGCISGIRLTLYVWGVGTQVKVKLNLEPKFRMASDVCEQDDFNADTPPRFAAIGGQIDGQVTAQIFICAVNAAHGMQVLSPSKCNFPLRGPTVGRGTLTLIDFSWKISYNAAVDDLLHGCVSSVADVKHFGGKIALMREALEGRRWENALFSQDLQPSCPKALQSLRRTWCLKGKQTKMLGNGTVDATGPPGVDETARQLGLLVRCSPADEYGSRLPGMRPLWFKRHTSGRWQWTPFEPGTKRRLRKWMFTNETRVSPTAKKWANKPLLAQNIQLVQILNGTYNETETLATQLGMVRCTLADYCFHSELDSTIWLRKVNSSWFWTPLDPTFIRRNKYWLPVSTSLIPESYPMWKSTMPTDAVLRVLKSLQTGRLMALASSVSSSSASRSAESSELSETSEGSVSFSRSRSSSSQSMASASFIPAAVKPKPGTGVIETNPKDRIARALRLTFFNGEFVDKKCMDDVLCDPLWFRKEHNQWWWTPYPPTHKKRQWFSTNIVRVPDDAPKPWTGRIPPDNDVKMIRVFARAAILGNADAKPAPIKQKPKRLKRK